MPISYQLLFTILFFVCFFLFQGAPGSIGPAGQIGPATPVFITNSCTVKRINLEKKKTKRSFCFLGLVRQERCKGQTGDTWTKGFVYFLLILI